MLIAERDASGTWQRVDDYVDVTRISEGLDQSGVLAPGPVARTRVSLLELAGRARHARAARVWITGTAPFRRASNGSEIAAGLADVFGVPVTVISGEREAELSLLATRRSFPDLASMIVIDIGGASTEIIRATEADTEMVSLDIGSVRLTERCVTRHPIDAAEMTALRLAIDAELDREKAQRLLMAPCTAMIGIAGTVTTLATTVLGMEDYDETIVHGYRLAISAVCDLVGSLAAETIEERIGRPGLPAKRADVLPAGALLLARVAERAAAAEVIVSDRGTRWGRLYAETDDD
jgi:exopolyphosphatase/guanosine-5'-triphosphate,3'-diphosphate pyrophosphatase